LILSYIFREAHDEYLSVDNSFLGRYNVQDQFFEYYSLGAIIGIITIGVLSDLVFKQKRFLTILIINLFLLIFDIVLFSVSDDQ